MSRRQIGRGFNGQRLLLLRRITNFGLRNSADQLRGRRDNFCQSWPAGR